MILLPLTLFWLCLGAMIHTYVTYPLSLRLFKRRYRVPPVMPENAWPTVAILVPAYNEERVIGAKVENCLALDYDPEKLEILIGSDGSTDRTNEIVRGFAGSRVKLVELTGRNGKTGVLNKLVEQTKTDILVFSDANVMLDKSALRLLIRHFADSSVGVVNGGKHILVPPGAKAVKGEAIYGKAEDALRTLESEVGGMSGALGSLMGLRRELYRPFVRGSTNDDTVPAIWAILAGMRQVHDPEAKAYEESGHSVAEEFRRRVRIGAGNYQTLFRYPQVLHPRYGVIAYTFFSHKVLRWFFPFLMAGALAGNAFLLTEPLYRGFFFMQLAAYALALLGWLTDLLKQRVPVASSLYHFTAMNLALLLGFFAYRRGIKSAAWERTPRETVS
jgi:cellulose synthase/poly-beta-1,6-N-acetylglucosamine synthase-like glycosyltransferase